MSFDDAQSVGALDIWAHDADELNGTATEDELLALLQQADLSHETIEQLSKSEAARKSRKVKLAIVCHAKTPRYVSLATLRQLFTFDLMQVALTPAVAGDLKKAAEEALINRLESMTLGERLSLARRASGRIAGTLLSDPEVRVIQEALENPRLTEVLIIRALNRDGTPALVQAICHHSKWSLRREIRIALLRNQHTPAVHVIEFARDLPASMLEDILHVSRLPENLKLQIRQLCKLHWHSH